MRMRQWYVATVALSLFVVSFCSLGAEVDDARQRLKHLSEVNSLDGEGMKPWHLHMTFSLNDLSGKPKESGTIEEWWVSPKSYRLVITSPSYNEPAAQGVVVPSTRERYLVHLLLSQVVHPMLDAVSSKELDVIASDRTMGKTALSCLSLGSLAQRSPQTEPEFCTEKGSDVLRVQFGGAELGIARNRLGTFREVHVAMDHSIAYGKAVAIEGHVDVLQSYTPPDTPAPAATSAPDATPSVESRPMLRGGVIAGQIVRKVQPIYPAISKSSGTQGTVLLTGTISKEGKISSLDAIASPDEAMAKAAMDAVKQWEYSPYLLNGQPTEVDTTITVNFNLVASHR